MKKTFILLAVLISLTACNNQIETNPPSQESQTPPNSEQTNTVSINEFKFTPDNLTINKGDTVTWNHDDKVTHTIKFTDFESPNMERGDKFTHTFDSTGTYDYYCSIHPSMRGKIIVK